MANLKIGSLQHKRSSVVNDENGIKTPKLPTPEKLVHGEIAINYAKDYETLSIKNSSGDVVTFSSDSIIDKKIDDIKKDLASDAELQAEVTRATGAEAELVRRVKVIEDAPYATESYVENVVNGLDATVGSQTVDDGKHVAVEVVEANGVITAVTVTESDIASKQALDDEVTRAKAAEKSNADAITTLNGSDTTLGSVAKAVADAKKAIEGTFKAGDVQTLAELNTKIETVSGAAKSYSIAKATDEEVGKLGTNVKEAYKLIDEDGHPSSVYIPVYKDSSLKSVALDGQILNFTYILANGSEDIVGVDVSTFLAESEFANGLQVVNHIVSVKVDATSEDFLTVGEGGVKLSGVQTAIDTAKKEVTDSLDIIKGEETVNGSIKKALKDAKDYTDAEIIALNATAGTKSVSEGKHVAVEVVETAGKLTSLVVTEKDIASATGLTSEIDRAKAAEKVNADAIAILNGDANTDGSVAKALQDAIGYTDNETRDLLDALSAEINEKSNIPLNVTELFTKDNSMTSYTLSDLSTKNLYHSNGNAVKFVGYEDSATNPTTNKANLVMEYFKDGIRTITIAQVRETVIENDSTITTDSVKTYSSNAFIMKISQSDYDTMKNDGTLDANTLYVIS